MSKKIIFCLSFDCDNEQDADIFPALIKILQAHEIKSSFAVCGQMVEERPADYRLLIQAGHEIMNHGYSKHTETWLDGEIISTLFYDDLDKQTIREEIIKNHRVVKDVLGYEMVGFRVPHFGTFQKAEQVLLIRSILKELGYLYNSSTLMATAEKLNLLDTSDNIEFPLSPIPGYPDSVFDSWGFFKAPNRTRNEKDFLKYFKMIIDSAINSKKPVFLNIYVDPSHVIHSEAFKKSLEYLDKMRNYIDNDLYRNLLNKKILCA